MPQTPIRIRINPVAMTTFEIGKLSTGTPPSIRTSAPEPIDDHTELAADFDTEQDRKHGYRARAEERTELAQGKHTAVQESAREDQARDPRDDEQNARQRFRRAENTATFSGYPGLASNSSITPDAMTAPP